MGATVPMGATLLARELLYRGHDLDIALERVRLPNGAEAELPMIHHPGAAAVVPFSAPDQILLIRQFRWATGGWILEIPAGKCRPGESPEDCATRELREEVGQTAARLEPLGAIWTVPGFADERIHLFAAYDLAPAPTALEPDELIEVVPMALREAVLMASTGELADAKSVCALLRLARRLEEPCPKRS